MYFFVINSFLNIASGLKPIEWSQKIINNLRSDFRYHHTFRNQIVPFSQSGALHPSDLFASSRFIVSQE